MEKKTRYLSAAETAKLVRAALKRAFPYMTFSVRSKKYSGGASIDVSWEDGPAKREVEAVVKGFERGRFDGSIDMMSHAEHWLLPDGTTMVADYQGTEGSKGIFPAVHNPQPHPDAERVSFGADFVFCQRRYSPALLYAVGCDVAKEWGLPEPDVAVSDFDGSGWMRNGNATRDGIWDPHHSLGSLTNRALEEVRDAA
jgi:hypothetical protein